MIFDKVSRSLFSFRLMNIREFHTLKILIKLKLRLLITLKLKQPNMLSSTLPNLKKNLLKINTIP